MPTVSRILSGAVEKLLFNPVTITGVEAVGESSRLLSMQGVGFQGVNPRTSEDRTPIDSFRSMPTKQKEIYDRPRYSRS
jgi:hypothetical protein